MPSYKVVLDDETRTTFNVTADDLEISGFEDTDTDGNTTLSNGTAFFNFLKADPKDGDDKITVAAIPYANVLYINS